MTKGGQLICIFCSDLRQFICIFCSDLGTHSVIMILVAMAREFLCSSFYLRVASSAAAICFNIVNMTRGLLTCLFWTAMAVGWVAISILSLAFDFIWGVTSVWFSTFGVWQTLVMIPIMTSVFVLGIIACYFGRSFGNFAMFFLKPIIRLMHSLARVCLGLL